MPSATPSSAVAVSIDLEEYFQVEAMAGTVAHADWGAMPARLEGNTERLLACFAEAQAQATFFVVGWVAERYPRLIAQVAAAGHELACHSYWHRPVFRLNRAEFREDTRRAKHAIEAAAGCAVAGYRAPNFSIRHDGSMAWALEELAQAGFAYDSSLHPIRHHFYGAAAAPRFPFRTAAGGLWEFPMATAGLGGQRWPVAGGGYWRLAPLPYVRWGLRRALREGQRAVCYLHPWELDPGQPRLPLPWRRRWRHYAGLAGLEAKLRAVLAEFGSQPLCRLYAAELAGMVEVPA